MKLMRIGNITILFLIILFFTECNFVNVEKAKDLNRIGLKYSAKGKKKQAINYFIAASLIKDIPDSDRTKYLGNIGEEYWFDNVDSSKYYYSKAVKLNDKNSYAGLFYMANVYILDNEIDKAEDLLLKAYKIDSLNMLANNLLGVIYIGENGMEYYNPQKALKYNLRSYNKYKDVHSTFVLAKNYYLINDITKAIPLFEDICVRAPDYTPYQGSLIMIYQELGRNKDANRLLSKLKNRDLPRYNRLINDGIQAGTHSLVWNPK
jgi:tetratricopeptide (TPR) repeat protein